MSIAAALNTYRRLTTTQKRFLKRKRISARYTPEQWLRLLGDLAEYDRHGDTVRRICGLGAIAGLITSVLLLFFSPLLIEGLGIPEGMAIFLGGFAAVITAACGTAYFLLKGKDLPNNLRDFVFPLIKILREDAKPGTPLQMTLDLRGGLQKNKLKNEDKQTQGLFSYPKIRDRFYTDPWFQGSARLADGSSLKWCVVDQIRARRITKKTSRGKIKVKYKHKIRRNLDVALGLHRQDYKPGQGHTPSDAKMSVKVGDKRNLLRLKRVFESRRADLGNNSGDIEWVLDLDQFVDLIATIYRGVERQPA